MEIKESKAMAEIREIRARLSEQMKNMTPGERLAFTRKGAAELEKEFEREFGRKLKKRAPVVK